jgi:uncharacterized SAM-binding protein YcdF (DUF218 family)
VSLQALLTATVLPPMLFAWAALIGGALAVRRSRLGGGLAMLGGAGMLILATPLVAGLLRASLETATAPADLTPAAIVILAAETRPTVSGTDVGALTLERLRAGAALHRTTGLPVLVTGGVLGADQPPVARLMADSLAADFGVMARWVEDAARDTRENAARSTALLRADSIAAAHLVTHAWHMPRAMAAFARAGLAVTPSAVRPDAPPDGHWTQFVPRADRLGVSWLMLREWAGRLVYRLRDGTA